MTVDEYKKILRQKLTEKRYHHSLCVADEAVRLAEKYGGDAQKAFYAGLLHDILKDTPGKEQLQLMAELGIIPTEIERSAPKLWHAMAGSAYLRREFGLPEDIVAAVRYHTTARAGMSLLEKILYLADFTSADRDYDGVEELRRAVDVSIEAAMRAALRFTIEDLCAKGLPIHPDTFMAYNEIMLLSRKKEV